MRVILKQSVPKVGKEGQVVRVKAGFARNFLFPRGMAIVADKAQMKVLEARNKRLEAQLAATQSSAQEVAEKIDGKRVRLEVKAGTGQRLFGAVTSQDIADAVKDQLGVELDRKVVGLLQPIKQLGHFSIDVDLHRHVDCRVYVDVVDPEAEEEARKAAELKAAEAPTGKHEGKAKEAAEPAPVEEPASVIEETVTAE
ncbi:MAG TPA: 50S ribosomal protein L9 [Fimbriimonadaceae bacterium]|nr:50S ribosomal protein L9 [Fimbriimonadaceae bacterium]